MLFIRNLSRDGLFFVFSVWGDNFTAMNEQLVSKYTDQFMRLKRAPQFGGAPHKPVLLLAVIKGIEAGEINSCRIFITPELVIDFREIWDLVVATPHKPKFSLPFFHLKSEPFWRLVCKPGTEILLTSSNSIQSFRALDTAIEYAEIDEDLFRLLSDPVSREILRQELMSRYFPDAGKIARPYTLINDLQRQILNDDPETYRKRIEEIERSNPEDEAEEELLVRSALFKREIPRIYNYQCAISGMRVTTPANVQISAQMVDACHIRPFADFKDDTIGNGLSLSPNLHRAFDRGLVTINDDFIVRVSPAIIEADSPYSLRQFEGKHISLPEDPKHYPLIQNLVWHRKERWLI